MPFSVTLFGVMKARPENPFIFGEVIGGKRFVNRIRELDQLVRDVSDGQKVFLLSPRRFGKSSLVSVAFERLANQGTRTMIVPVSSYSSYTQFLERFAEKVLRAAGPWERIKGWMGQFIDRVTPQAGLDMKTGEVRLSLGLRSDVDPTRLAPEVFALAGELTRKGKFKMAICLDEFQQIGEFDGRAVENALRNAVQNQRQVGYVFSGSQPSLMKQMLGSNRPFHKAGPVQFLDKIAASDWEEFISRQFQKRNRTIEVQALQTLLVAADLIPYDVQRIAHELWDYAELANKQMLEEQDVEIVIQRIIFSQADSYERLWQQLTMRQRAALQALSNRGPEEIYSQAAREEYRLGAPSTVQKALLSLDKQDILDVYQGTVFFVDPLFARWVKRLFQR